MCGIIGVVSNKYISQRDLWVISKDAERRGLDSSGILFNSGEDFLLKRSNKSLTKLIRISNFKKTNFIIGHSRLITNSLKENQPVKRESIYVIHNGIVVNSSEVWDKINLKANLKIDSEAIAAIVQKVLDESQESSKKINYKSIFKSIKKYTKGTISCAIMIPKLGKILLYSNNGSLHLGHKNKQKIFSSEKYILEKLSCEKISQIREIGKVIIALKIDSAHANLIGPKLVGFNLSI